LPPVPVRKPPRRTILIRRAVALAAIAAIFVLAIWLVTSGGSSAGDDDSAVASTEAGTTSTTEVVEEEPKVIGCLARNKGVEYRNGKRKKRVVALTFDDGPGPSTPGILDILNARKVRATFFVLGQMAQESPELLQRILDQGSEIGNHSWGHENDAPWESVSRTSELIEDLTGYRPCLYRPPYGTLSPTGLANAKELGMATILWDIDSLDWSNPGVDHIVSQAEAARNGSIILLHDAGRDRAETVVALPELIKKLRKRNFKFVTVTELLRFKPVHEGEEELLEKKKGKEDETGGSGAEGDNGAGGKGAGGKGAGGKGGGGKGGGKSKDDTGDGSGKS